MIETPSHSNIGDWRGFLFINLNGKTGFEAFELVGFKLSLSHKKQAVCKYIGWLYLERPF